MAIHAETGELHRLLVLMWMPAFLHVLPTFGVLKNATRITAARTTLGSVVAA